MNTPMFFNHHSLPAATAEAAHSLLLDMCRGIAVLISRKLCDRQWIAENNIEEIPLAPDYYFAHFRNQVVRGRDRDIFLLLNQLALRFPVAGNLSERILNVYDRTDAILRECPQLGASSLLAAASVSNGIVISLATAPIWGVRHLSLSVVCYDDEMVEIARDDEADIRHVSCVGHATDIVAEFSALENTLRLDNWATVLPHWDIHSDFCPWLNEQPENVIRKIMENALYVQEKNFLIDRPRVGTIYGTTLKNINLKELRIVVGNANPLRIFFVRKADGGAIMLTGGFKADNSFYDQQIPIAESRFQAQRI